MCLQWWLRRRVLALGCVLVLGACSGVIDDADVGSAGRGSGNPGRTPDGGPAGGSAADYVGSPTLARRLSRAELDNTLRDLLGDETAPASHTLAEDLYAPYDNDYPSQLASGAYVEALDLFASDAATRALSNAAQRKQLIPCTPTGPNDAACFRDTVTQLLRRAFRRPLASGEADAYASLLPLANEPSAARVNDSPFDTAVALAVRSVVQDPEFLYRLESGAPTDDPNVFALNDHEIGVRLSYLLWASAPDAPLRAAAEAGQLRAKAGRRAAAERLLDDARAREQLHRFHAMWLGYRAVPHSPQLAAALARETNALLDRVIFEEPQSYLHLFSFAETYLDGALADHYGLPRPSGASGWVAYGDSGRAGILSHGSVLSAFGKFSDTSPTQRGIFVRTRLLCQEIPPPPPTVTADKPPAGDQDAVCKADRYREHRTSSSCSGCHSLTDGIGFGLENYDLAGRFRTHDEGLTQCSIDGRGEINGVGTFRGPKELGALLVDRGLLDACVVQQFLQFAIGRKLDADETPALEQLRSVFADSDHDLLALILDFVASDAFARRVEPENKP